MAALKIGNVYAVVLGVVVMSVLHTILGLVSVCVGVASSVSAEVWLAHTVSPIWSGVCFMFTGFLGFTCAKRKTSYLIMCFTAFSLASLIPAVVSIQLLRIGLVNHTTDGDTYQKEEKDIFILIALATAGVEILICIISSLVSCRMAKAAKSEMFQKRASMFHVQARLQRKYAARSGYYEGELDMPPPDHVPHKGLDNLAMEKHLPRGIFEGSEGVASYTAGMYGDLTPPNEPGEEETSPPGQGNGIWPGSF